MPLDNILHSVSLLGVGNWGRPEVVGVHLDVIINRYGRGLCHNALGKIFTFIWFLTLVTLTEGVLLGLDLVFQISIIMFFLCYFCRTRNENLVMSGNLRRNEVLGKHKHFLPCGRICMEMLRYTIWKANAHKQDSGHKWSFLSSVTRHQAYAEKIKTTGFLKKFLTALNNHPCDFNITSNYNQRLVEYPVERS